MSDMDLKRIVRDFQRVSEKVATLNGGAAKDMAAVRVGQFSVLASIPAEMTAKKVTAAPTADEFNALLEDVRNIYNKLVFVSQQISKSG